jgi:hypothetical protein
MRQVEALGVVTMYEVVVQRLLGRGDQLEGIILINGDKEEIIELTSVIVASGRIPDLVIVPLEKFDDDPSRTKWQAIRSIRGNVPGKITTSLFEDVEPLSDHRAAVEAIAAGRRSASTLHRLIFGQPQQSHDQKEVLPPPCATVETLFDLRDARRRVEIPEISLVARVDPKVEITLGLTEEQAILEAERCLNCGLICYQRAGAVG